ncbi:MAG: amidohydrolase family protein, partial [Gammaproteobacteria bacterium]
EKTMRVAEAHERSIKMFYAAGGKIAMGTDAGTPFNLHGNNAQELRYMVQYGISPMDAIVFSTSNAADLMQLSDQGRVKDGARANLLAVGGNPLENIECVSERANHKFVMCGGTIV